MSVLSKLLRGVFGSRKPDEVAHDELPDDMAERIYRANSQAPVELHRSIAFKGLRVGSVDLLELVDECTRTSRTKVGPAKFVHRPLSFLFLAQYLLHTAHLSGARAECGVYSGASALLMCKALGMHITGYRGEDLHLVDSFEGLADAAEQDLIPTRDRESGRVSPAPGFDSGTFALSADFARRTLAEFPMVTIHQGRIPDVLGQLPEKVWSFVHIDVDLYVPTRACLEYFYPRLVDNGVIICDDYGAPLYPGAHKAWDEFCAERNIRYVILDTGQSVLIKGA